MLRSLTLITVNRILRQKRSLSQRRRGCNWPVIALLFLAGWLCLPKLSARDQWAELNIGPFRVDTDKDASEARDALANLEQLRWILSGMLEAKDLNALWPMRFLITSRAEGAPAAFVRAHGEYVFCANEVSAIPLEQVAKLFIESNTPRLPPEVESALPVLFAKLQAHGSRVTWAAPPAIPNVDFARLHLFATKPEYAGRFHVFLNNLRAGSALRTAEANAFGSDSQSLEREVKQHLDQGAFQPQTISARPLDPRRDFGEHSLNGVVADVYLADIKLKTNAKQAEAAYKAAIEAGHVALGQEGLALIVMDEGTNPTEYLDSAMAAGSKDAWVYVEAAKRLPESQAVALLKTAATLNPRWYEPVYLQAKLSGNLKEKEALLAAALKLNPRLPDLWQELALMQSASGKAMSAQNSWARAEDNAGSPEERQRIHTAREAADGKRLDAEEAERRAAANAAKVEDDRLRNDQMTRIHAAEQRANDASDALNPQKPSKVLDWWSAGNPLLEGQLVRVDCLERKARLLVKTTAGKSIQLLVADPSQYASQNSGGNPWTCGTQTAAKRLSVTYKPRLDKQFGTSGDVISIHFE